VVELPLLAMSADDVLARVFCYQTVWNLHLITCLRVDIFVFKNLSNVLRFPNEDVPLPTKEELHRPIFFQGLFHVLAVELGLVHILEEWQESVIERDRRNIFWQIAAWREKEHKKGDGPKENTKSDDENQREVGNHGVGRIRVNDSYRSLIQRPDQAYMEYDGHKSDSALHWGGVSSRTGQASIAVLRCLDLDLESICILNRKIGAVTLLGF
jgi:hypothetical protein